MIQSDNNKRAATSQEAILLRAHHNNEPPLGENIKVKLNGKSWGKSTNLICYFTEIESGINFTLSLFRSKKDGKSYCAPDHKVDFSETGIVGNLYCLNIQKSSRSKFASLKGANLYFSEE
ncbi:hypothetical protein [Vibrio fluvialis]|uniref:hypothetical protein n=1 Tax=Vibrio fluvialis TaxID=676 RepID=UPI0005720821|nr:hypothetical protein [Vibrio fluvialis]